MVLKMTTVGKNVSSSVFLWTKNRFGDENGGQIAQQESGDGFDGGRQKIGLRMPNLATSVVTTSSGEGATKGGTLNT